MPTIALARCLGGSGSVVQPQHAQYQHHRCADQTQAGRGERCGAEVRHRNGVLDGWGAGQGCRREGEGTECNRCRNQALGQLGLAEQRCGDRVDRKGDDEQRHPAIGQHCTGQNDGQHGALGTQRARDDPGNDQGGPAGLHQLADYRAQQEERKERDHEAAERRHEDLGVAGQQRCGRAEKDCQQRAQRREQEHANAAVGQGHQQGQREHDADNADYGWKKNASRPCLISGLRRRGGSARTAQVTRVPMAWRIVSTLWVQRLGGSSRSAAGQTTSGIF
ncbi:hypothetical protein [Polaromonas sp.]|uniref:hypothetical protein n=1 Tax=Polaromonas sp. TaxID=1869339 RepID=UPI003569B711